MFEDQYITEKDIFNYVFFRYLLKQEKINRIEENDFYLSRIEFYNILKRKLEEASTIEEKRKIAKRIEAYSLNEQIFLYPIKEESLKKKLDFLVLAADSPKEEPIISTKTFVNEENGYLIKLLTLNNSTKVFIFSAREENLKNYKIVFYPSQISFTQADNSLPLEINQKIEAEKIGLNFQLF